MRRDVTYPKRATAEGLHGAVRELLERSAARPFQLFGNVTKVHQDDCTADLGRTTLVDPTNAALTVFLPELLPEEAGSVVLIVNAFSSTNGFVVQAMDGAATINGLALTSSNTTAYGVMCLQAVTRTEWIILWSR